MAPAASPRKKGSVKLKLPQSKKTPAARAPGKKGKKKKSQANLEAEEEEGGGDEDEVVIVEGGGARSDTIPWSDNPAWLGAAVDYLTDNPSFRLKLFSDSTEDAKVEGRAKKQAKESKIGMYSTLCDHVFSGPEVSDEDEEEIEVDDSDCVVDAEWRQKYKEDPSRFAKSLQQQFARLKTKYSKKVKTLYATGGGLKSEDMQTNLIEKIKEEFPHWDELHSFWRELPNYNPIGVSNSSGGTDHASRAESLFNKRRGDSSGVEDSDDRPPVFAKSSSVSLAGDDTEDEEEEKEKKSLRKTSTGTKPVPKGEKDRVKNKNLKAGDKRPFDLSSLDAIHQQDLEESARRRDSRLELESRRTELQIERERNKRAKLELEKDRLKREDERERRMFDLIASMRGPVPSGSQPGSSSQFPPPSHGFAGFGSTSTSSNYDGGYNHDGYSASEGHSTTNDGFDLDNTSFSFTSHTTSS
ncbi:hypothetical protein R3P38DRAFT_2780517 [Favolaschia claudopus]|uniref:Uncharacterized protein n=1 Tax=Favolaschia claudopus TaxID=2862362 RepID=A0AAW0BA61_9AGAR